jgi:hypothetical protein
LEFFCLCVCGVRGQLADSIFARANFLSGSKSVQAKKLPGHFQKT